MLQFILCFFYLQAEWSRFLVSHKYKMVGMKDNVVVN